MIDLKDIHFRYPGGIAALNGVALLVDEGELLCLAGANGCGKSTLLSLLAGLLDPQHGQIIFTDMAVDGNMLRSRCRLIMQNPDMQILGATVEEDLMLGRNAADRERALSVLFSLGFDAPLDRPVHTLSWGMKRKLCVASALLDSPDILLFDEPFSGLDYAGICEMRRVLLQNNRDGVTQIVAAHDLECVADMATRFALMAKGQIVASGFADTVFDRLRDNGVRPPCSWVHMRELRPWDTV